MKLENISDKELEDEINRRKKANDIPPPVIENPDFSRVSKSVIDYITALANDEYDDEDFKQWIYEAALEAMYGGQIWSWKNKR